MMEDMTPNGPLAILFFLLGLTFGSFGNVLIFRVPAGKSIGGRSKCPGCGKTITFPELIPVLSYLILRGQCSKCRVRLSIQYPLVELASGILFVLAISHSGFDLASGLLLALCLWLLLVMAVTDARTGLLPDAFTMPFLGLALSHALLLGSFPVTPVLLGIAFFGIQWIVSRGRWTGSGDILLAAGIGALLADTGLLLVALGIAYVTGAVYAVWLLARRRAHGDTAVPFGPFLAFGAIIAVFCGTDIVRMLMGG